MKSFLPLSATVALGYVLMFSEAFAGSVGADRRIPEATTATELEWMKGMPSPPGSREYLVELRRRIAAGPRVRLKAVYHGFRQFGGSRFALDSEGERTWSVTTCQVISPERYKGWVIPINHSVELPVSNCWRTEGCVAEFDVNERVVEALHNDIFGFTESIFDSQLGNPKLDVPGGGAKSSSIARPRSVDASSGPTSSTRRDGGAK
jgi:hypothetical protein